MTLFRVASRRLIAGVATLFAVSAAVFFGMATLQGNAAQVALGQSATPQAVAVLTHQFGLNRPIVTQYFDWLEGLLQGHLGHSLPTGVAVSTVLAPRIGNTLVLAAATMLVLIPLGLGLGVVSALRPDSWWDHVVAGSTLTLIATPSFVLGSLLIVVFSSWIHVLPSVS